MTCKSALAALSGGVDSAVCALLLQEQGVRVEGVVLEFSPAHTGAVEAAKRCADALHIPLHVVRCHEAFDRDVIRPFAESYYTGRTPNPCVICNPRVKFRLLCETADSLGLEGIATGHYAAVVRCGERWAVRRAQNVKRDQSYMLYRLTQDQLSRLLLPIEAMPKEDVRLLASRRALPCADAPDSQEICFLEDGDYASYLERRFGPSRTGNFLAPDGSPCGKHRGILHYTVGQRKGLGLSLGEPVFIRRIDAETGDIELGTDALRTEAVLSDCVWMPFPELPGSLRVQAKIRSQARLADALLTPLSGGYARVVFDTPQHAPAPGQSCVVYDGDGLLLGGGFIEPDDPARR